MTVNLQALDRSKWQELVPFFMDYNYRQLWDYGVACAERINATSEHVAIYNGSELIGMADVRVKHIPLFKSGIAYINGGPMVRRDSSEDAQRLQTALQVLIDEYVHRRKHVLRVQPSLGSSQWIDLQQKVFQESGFRNAESLRGYRTIVLDLDLPLEVLRTQFQQKWRNCLNKSQRQDLDIRTAVTSKDWSEFALLYKKLLDRKQFQVDLDILFYEKVNNQLGDSEKFVLTLASHQEDIVAGHVASFLGDTCVYLLGASNKMGLKTNAAYLLQWSVLEMAYQKKCLAYDLGGIDPEKNPGVYHFKSGMGGRDVTFPGPYEIYPDRFRKTVVKIGEYMYQKIRGRS